MDVQNTNRTCLCKPMQYIFVKKEDHKYNKVFSESTLDKRRDTSSSFCTPMQSLCLKHLDDIVHRMLSKMCSLLYAIFCFLA